MRLPQLLTQPYLEWQPHHASIHNLGSQHQRQQAQLLILASLHLAVITGVPHSWPTCSAGVRAVPATISMSDNTNDNNTSGFLCNMS